MRSVAMISQGLRAEHCKAYIDQNPGRWLVLTTSPREFEEWDVYDDVEVSGARPPGDLLPSRGLTFTRWYRSIVRWARSGSALGQIIERVARSAKALLRRQRKVTVPTAGDRVRPVVVNDLRLSGSFQRLLAEDRTESISLLVVFDVFDLPVALEFSRETGVEVLVR